MFNLFLKTWKNLRLILFVPDLMLIIFNLILANLFLVYTGLGNFASKINSLPAKVEALPLIREFISAHFLSLVLFGLVFVFVNFILGSGLLSIKYGLMRDVVKKKKLRFLEYGGEYLWSIVKVKFLIFLIMVAFIFIFGIIATGIYFLFPERFAFIFLLILSILVLVALKLALLFRFPALFFKDKSAFFSLRNSFLFFNRKFWVVLFSFLIILMVGISLSLVYIGFTKLIGLLGNVNFVWMLIALQAGGIIFNLINNVWSDLFLFYIFKEKQ